MLGVVSLFRGAWFVYFRHPGLIRYWIIPVLIVAALSVSWFGYLWSEHEVLLADYVWSEPQGDGIWNALLRFFHSSLEWIVFLLALILGLLVIYALTSVIASPFNDMLSEAVERLAQGKAPPPFRFRTLIREAFRTIFFELLKLCLYLAVMLPLFVLSWTVPAVGTLLYSVFAFLFSSWYLSLDYMDWSIARRGHSISHRFSLLFRYPVSVTGFGAGVWVLLWVPFLHLFTMPAAVSGATLLYLRLERQMVGPKERGSA